MLRNMQNMSSVAQKKKAQQHQELIASSCPTQLLAHGSEQYPRRYLLWNPFIYCNP
jgi:hypothetical protein